MNYLCALVVASSGNKLENFEIYVKYFVIHIKLLLAGNLFLSPTVDEIHGCCCR